MAIDFGVTFVQKFVPHYRLPFFERLRDRLDERGIALRLVYGLPDPFEASKVRVVRPSWGTETASRIVRLRGRYLYWQGAMRHVRRGDLVVVEHAAKLLDNYPLYVAARLGRLHLSYYGHGENFLADGELALSRRVKRAMLTDVAQWFAYTDISRASLLRQGVDDRIVSVVNNTLPQPPDTFATEAKTRGLTTYVGGLYADKRIDLLLEAGALLAARHPDFALEVIGDGPLRPLVESTAGATSWLRYRGPLYGRQRDLALARSNAILMPGAVGLVAIDSLHFRCPIVTRAGTAHGPEIAYLEHERNALLGSPRDGAADYARLVSRLLHEPELAGRLHAGCSADASRYTIEDMVERFCNGVDRVRSMTISRRGRAS